MENSVINGIVDIVAASYFDGKTKAQSASRRDGLRLTGTKLNKLLTEKQ